MWKRWRRIFINLAGAELDYNLSHTALVWSFFTIFVCKSFSDFTLFSLKVKYDSKCETKYLTVYEEVCDEVKDDYGAPAAPVLDSYGSPAADPIDQYGTPQAPPVACRQVPKQQEKEECTQVPREECVQVPREVPVQVPEQVIVARRNHSIMLTGVCPGV